MKLTVKCKECDTTLVIDIGYLKQCPEENIECPNCKKPLDEESVIKIKNTVEAFCEDEHDQAKGKITFM